MSFVRRRGAVFGAWVFFLNIILSVFISCVCVRCVMWIICVVFIVLRSVVLYGWLNVVGMMICGYAFRNVVVEYSMVS